MLAVAMIITDHLQPVTRKMKAEKHSGATSICNLDQFINSGLSVHTAKSEIMLENLFLWSCVTIEGNTKEQRPGLNAKVKFTHCFAPVL